MASALDRVANGLLKLKSMSEGPQTLADRIQTVRQLKIDLTFFNNIPPCVEPSAKECILASEINFKFISFRRGLWICYFLKCWETRYPRVWVQHECAKDLLWRIQVINISILITCIVEWSHPLRKCTPSWAFTFSTCFLTIRSQSITLKSNSSQLKSKAMSILKSQSLLSSTSWREATTKS